MIVSAKITDCFHLIEFLVATKVGRNMDRPLIIPLFVKRDFPTFFSHIPIKMKTIRLIIAGLVMTMGFSSCSSLFYDAKVDVLNSIQKGMSRQEVTKILGTPEYRRFDRDIEEWEYSRVLSGKSNISRTQIVVTFEGGRVVAMDSFSGEPRTLPVVPSEVVIDSPAPVYVRGMHPEDFRHFYEKVKSRPFKDDQIEMMRTVARNNSLNCVQCASLMALYTFDDDKMKVLNIFAPNIVDPENYEAILDVIDSLFKKDDAKKILGIRY